MRRGIRTPAVPSTGALRRYAAAINLQAPDLPKLDGYGREEEVLPNPEHPDPCGAAGSHAALDEIRSERFETPVPESIALKFPPVVRIHSTVVIFATSEQATGTLAAERSPAFLRCLRKHVPESGGSGPLVQSSFASRPLRVGPFTGERFETSKTYLPNRGSGPIERQATLVIDKLAFPSGPALVELIYSHEPGQHVSGQEQRLLTLLRHRVAKTPLETDNG